jgi:hypothetical protein
MCRTATGILSSTMELSACLRGSSSHAGKLAQAFTSTKISSRLKWKGVACSCSKKSGARFAERLSISVGATSLPGAPAFPLVLIHLVA